MFNVNFFETSIAQFLSMVFHNAFFGGPNGHVWSGWCIRHSLSRYYFYSPHYIPIISSYCAFKSLLNTHALNPRKSESMGKYTLTDFNFQQFSSGLGVSASEFWVVSATGRRFFCAERFTSGERNGKPPLR